MKRVAILRSATRDELRGTSESPYVAAQWRIRICRAMANGHLLLTGSAGGSTSVDHAPTSSGCTASVKALSQAGWREEEDR